MSYPFSSIDTRINADAQDRLNVARAYLSKSFNQTYEHITRFCVLCIHRATTISFPFLYLIRYWFVGTADTMECSGKLTETSMHSRRMRTVRRLTVSHSIRRGGVALGACLPRGVSDWGVCPVGCIPAYNGADTPWTEWQTGVKTLPCPKHRLQAVKRCDLSGNPTPDIRGTILELFSRWDNKVQSMAALWG